MSGIKKAVFSALLSLGFLFFPLYLVAQEEKPEKSKAPSPEKEERPSERGTDEPELDREIVKILERIQENMKKVSTIFTDIEFAGENKPDPARSDEKIGDMLQSVERRQVKIVEDLEELIQKALSMSPTSRGQSSGQRGQRREDPSQSNNQQNRDGKREREDQEGLHQSREEKNQRGRDGQAREEAKQGSAKEAPPDATGPGAGKKHFDEWGQLPRKLMEVYRNLPRGVNLNKIPPEYLDKLNEYSKKLSGAEKK